MICTRRGYKCDKALAMARIKTPGLDVLRGTWLDEELVRSRRW